MTGMPHGSSVGFVAPLAALRALVRAYAMGPGASSNFDVPALSSAAAHHVDVRLHGWAWSLAESQFEFIPDVMVYPDAPDGPCFSGTPPPLVELLSTNRSDDLTTKTRLSAHHGAPRFWVVDLRDHVLLAFELTVTAYQRTARLTAGSMLLEVADARVDVNLDAFLRP